MTRYVTVRFTRKEAAVLSAETEMSLSEIVNSTNGELDHTTAMHVAAGRRAVEKIDEALKQSNRSRAGPK